MHREHTKKVRIGDVTIGGGSPVAIQSMTNTKTSDIVGTVQQILRLEDAGCDIIRCAVPDRTAASLSSCVAAAAQEPICPASV